MIGFDFHTRYQQTAIVREETGDGRLPQRA